MNGLALCTEAVLACSDIVVAGGGLPVLLGIAKAPGRGKEAAEALRATLTCLANICRSRWVCWVCIAPQVSMLDLHSCSLY